MRRTPPIKLLHSLDYAALDTDIPPRIDMQHPRPTPLTKVTRHGMARVSPSLPSLQRFGKRTKGIGGVKRGETEGGRGLGAAGETVADKEFLGWAGERDCR
jgi:hypothetical protein